MDDLRKGVDFIGVCVPFIVHDGKGNFLMHKRSQKCRDEQGRWDVGSGSVEFGESLEETIKREIKEEFGADTKEVKELGIYTIIRDNNGQKTHWLAISHAVKVDPKQVKNGDPERIEELGWFNVKNIPSPRHSQLHKTLSAAKRHGVV